MYDAPTIDRIQSYRVCGRITHGGMSVEEYNNAFSDGYFSVAEPPADHDQSVIIYSGKGDSLTDSIGAPPTYLGFDLDTVEWIIESIPDGGSVYGEGRIYSFTEDAEYTSAFTGSTPMLITPYPDRDADNTGIRLTFGQPLETATTYFLTPKQTEMFQELLSGVKICQNHNDRYYETIEHPSTINSDGLINDRSTLGDLFT